MSPFWGVVALLVIGVLLIILPGLRRIGRGAAWWLVLAIPAIAVTGYLLRGSPDAASHRAPAVPAQAGQDLSALQAQVQRQPDDALAWLALAKAQVQVANYAEAVRALRRVVELRPAHAGLLADLADVIAMTQGRRLAGEPVHLVLQALDIDPRHTKALALAGSAANEARDWAAARHYWERLAAVEPATSEMARLARANLEQVSRQELQTASASAPPTPKPAVGASVSGTVVVAPTLAGRVPAGATLFVFARAAQGDGPRMPLAVLRLPATPGPVAFSLDDSLAMTPATRLSGFAKLVVGARISRSGNATPQPGDLIGLSAVVQPGARDVTVRIDRVQ